MVDSHGSGESSDLLALLLLTMQPIDALELPKFMEMIEISARAKNGVRIPGRKATREEIINTFKRRLRQLKDKFNVRPWLSEDICRDQQ